MDNPTVDETDASRSYVLRAFLYGIACCGAYAIIARSLAAPLHGNAPFVRHELIGSAADSAINCAAWCFAAVALLASGRRRLFVVPAILLFAQQVGWSFYFPSFRWFVDGACFSLLSLLPALLVMKRIPPRPWERPTRTQRAAIVVCFLVAIAPLATLYIGPTLVEGAVIQIPYLSAFAVFGAGIGTRKPAWPWAHAVVPLAGMGGLAYLFLFGEGVGSLPMFLVPTAFYAFICYVAAMWMPLSGLLSRLARTRPSTVEGIAQG